MTGCLRCLTAWSGECRRHRRERVAAQSEAAWQATVVEHVTWFERTGHCGGCGQPGAYCLCTDTRPCGCAHLHAMGSGLTADPAAVFAHPIDDQQQELF